MTDEELEIVVFNDKSWVRVSEYMELKAKNRELKNSIEKNEKENNRFNLQ